MQNPDSRALAARFYNASWELLDRGARSDDDNALLLTTAFASRAHWLEAGGTQQWIISEWMVSRAAAATGWGDLSLFFALRAYNAAQSPGTADWLGASTAEGVARAYGAMGDAARREEWIQRADALVREIADEEDRSLIAAQLASLAS